MSDADNAREQDQGPDQSAFDLAWEALRNGDLDRIRETLQLPSDLDDAEVVAGVQSFRNGYQLAVSGRWVEAFPPLSEATALVARSQDLQLVANVRLLTSIAEGEALIAGGQPATAAEVFAHVASGLRAMEPGVPVLGPIVARLTFAEQRARFLHAVWAHNLTEARRLAHVTQDRLEDWVAAAGEGATAAHVAVWQVEARNYLALTLLTRYWFTEASEELAEVEDAAETLAEADSPKEVAQFHLSTRKALMALVEIADKVIVRRGPTDSELVEEIAALDLPGAVREMRKFARADAGGHAIADWISDAANTLTRAAEGAARADRTAFGTRSGLVAALVFVIAAVVIIRLTGIDDPTVQGVVVVAAVLFGLVAGFGLAATKFTKLVEGLAKWVPALPPKEGGAGTGSEENQATADETNKEEAVVE